MQYEKIDNDEIDRKIIEERNIAMSQINQDMIDLSEISKYLSEMFVEQGNELIFIEKKVDHIENDVEKSAKNLEISEKINSVKYKIVKDVLIVLGGIGAGGLGFIAGPFIGAATLIGGATIGGGIVYAKNKLKK